LRAVKKTLWRDSKGLTLVELLVALVLSSLLLSFVFTLHLFSNKLVFNWQKKTALEDATLLCMETLIGDLQSMDEVIDAGKHKISFKDLAGREIAYLWNGHQILRIGETLNKEKTTIDNLEFVYYRRTPVLQAIPDASRAVSEEIDLKSNFSYALKQEKMEQISGVQISLTVSGYGKTLTLSSFIRLNKALSIY
jgi:prepilin-type N-terminal cleavage/methylation domain-containing protein